MTNTPSRALPPEHLDALEATAARMQVALVDERVARSALQSEARRISLTAFHTQLSESASESRQLAKRLMKLRRSTPARQRAGHATREGLSTGNVASG
jgi:hypothetical protein